MMNDILMTFQGGMQKPIYYSQISTMVLNHNFLLFAKSWRAPKISSFQKATHAKNYYAWQAASKGGEEERESTVKHSGAT